jgi:hypothetical protein
LDVHGVVSLLYKLSWLESFKNLNLVNKVFALFSWCRVSKTSQRLHGN